MKIANTAYSTDTWRLPPAPLDDDDSFSMVADRNSTAERDVARHCARTASGTAAVDPDRYGQDDTTPHQPGKDSLFDGLARHHSEALATGQLADPDGGLATWQLRSATPGDIRADEADLAADLIAH